MSDALKDAVTQRRSRTELRTKALDDGMVPLAEDGWSKVQAGLTTIEEVLRVVQ
jgi:type II secretory ATPase GspE/PulE/Tfp pilus assembly ATPase PilB-like protein